MKKQKVGFVGRRFTLIVNKESADFMMFSNMHKKLLILRHIVPTRQIEQENTKQTDFEF